MRRFQSQLKTSVPSGGQVLVFLLLMMTLLVAMQAQAQSSVRPPSNAVVNNTPETPPGEVIAVPNPAADLWNQVRARESAPVRTQIEGAEAGVLIRTGGEEWRNFRMMELIPKAGMLLAITFGIIVVFRLVRGKIKIQAGRSGKTIPRFTKWQRYTHWTTAILFVILGVTGMVLMFGRAVLLPVFGPEVFGFIALVGKRLHDFLGPLFGFALIALVIMFIRGNVINSTDFKWAAKGGGLFGGHASAGRYNLGEKAWFWFATLGGAVLVVSGFVLDFPNFGQTRETMEYYHMLHGIASACVLAFAFGHIFMGTVAMEGAFEAMATGECDENWAKEHHDLWYQELTGESVDHGDDQKTSGPVDGAKST